MTREDFYKIALEKANQLDKIELEKGILDIYKKDNIPHMEIIQIAFEDSFFNRFGELEYEQMLDRNDF